MDEQKRVPEKKNWQYSLRGAGCFIILFLLKSLTTPRLAAFATGELPSQLFYGFALLGILLIYNSVVHTFTFYDTDSFAKFKKRGIERVRFFDELGFILRSSEFWLETLPMLGLTLLFSLFGGFYEMVFTVFPVGGVPGWAFRIIPLFAMPIMLFSVSLICRYEIHRYWFELMRKGEENRMESKVKFILKLALIFLMYPLVFPYAPYVIFLIVTFFGIVGALISVLSIVGFIAAVIGIVFGIIGLMKWKSHRLRKRFINDVRATAKERGEHIDVYDKEERAVRGYDMTLTSGGKTYAVKIITAISGFTPLYFTSSADAYFLHRLGTNKHHTSIEKHFDYSFVSDSKKLIVIIKFPKKLFASEFGATRKLYSGDKIWNYIVFNTSSFLGAQDRECLYRSNDENR